MSLMALFTRRRVVLFLLTVFLPLLIAFNLIPIGNSIEALYEYYNYMMEPTASLASILNLDHDVLREICQVLDESGSINRSGGQIQKLLQALSQTNKTLRGISAPEIFREIVIRGDWRKAERLIDEIQDCPPIANYTRTFKFDIFDPHRPPKNVPSQLARLMTPMTNLTKLVLVLPEYHVSIFEKAFQKSGLSLPEVKTVVVGPYNEFILSMLPNVETVSANGWQWLHSKRDAESKYRREHTKRLITAVARAKTAKGLEIMEWWNDNLAKAVTDQLPNLHFLALDGGQYYTRLDKLLPRLSLMSYLETLALASSGNLGIGFDGGPWCGNAYDGPHGEELARQVAQDAKEAENKAAGMVLNAFREQGSLNNLWVGDGVRFEFVKDEEGKLKEFVRHEEQRDKIVPYPQP